MSPRQNVLFTGRNDWRSEFESVRALCTRVRERPAILLPVAAVIAHVPDGDLRKARDVVSGYKDAERAWEAICAFLQADDGPLDKRRADFVETLAWNGGPFRISRAGGPLYRWHEARYEGPEFESAFRSDVVFHVQDRYEVLECKVNLNGWCFSEEAQNKIAYLNRLAATLENDASVRTAWVGYVTALTKTELVLPSLVSASQVVTIDEFYNQSARR